MATFARICSYDRAGDGWSDIGPTPRTLHQIVYELHTLLERAGERPPYLLVGQNILAANSGHHVQLDEPQLVITAIRGIATLPRK